MRLYEHAKVVLSEPTSLHFQQQFLLAVKDRKPNVTFRTNIVVFVAIEIYQKALTQAC